MINSLQRVSGYLRALQKAYGIAVEDGLPLDNIKEQIVLTSKERERILLELNHGIHLEDCPFCLGAPRLKHGKPYQQGRGKRISFVQCTICEAKSKTFEQLAYQAWEDVDKLAADSWNSRPKSFEF